MVLVSKLLHVSLLRISRRGDWNFALLVVPVYRVVNLTVYISSLFSLVVFPTTVETPNMFLVQLLV